MKKISKTLKKSAFLILFLILNMGLSFLLEPAKGASEGMWKSYYAQEELDMIFIGSSLCQGGFDPLVFDEKLGVNSFNMGTPLQAVPQTTRALETALENHDIKTVIFGMGFSTLKYDSLMEAELTFEKARIKQLGGVAALKESIRYLYSEDIITDEKSINFFFPWLYNRGELTKEELVQNVSKKLEGVRTALSGKNTDEDLKGNVSQEAVEEGSLIESKGYESYGDVVFNYDNMWELNTSRYYEPELNADMMDALEEMIQICKEKGVDLMVINTPHPKFDLISCYEFYEENEREVKALCDKYEVDYYDFNLAKPEIFESRPDYYSDYEHLNWAGSQAFSRELSDFLIRRANGEEMQQHFYTVEEYLTLYADLLEDWKNYYW